MAARALLAEIVPVLAIGMIDHADQEAGEQADGERRHALIERLRHDLGGVLCGSVLPRVALAPADEPRASQNGQPLECCSTVKKENGPVKIHIEGTDANFSSLRRTALALLKNERTEKVGIKNKRLTAGWNDDYLEQVLFGQ